MQDYLDKLEAAINHEGYDEGVIYHHNPDIYKAAQHLATLIRKELAGECKSAPCVFTTPEMFRAARNYIGECAYKEAISAAPSTLKELVGE
jgi:hypothetical protein